jgi:peptide-methionine (S)-S-oxide reductase
MEKKETIVLGGGCFWCIEAIFQRVDGVIGAVPGYAGGTFEDPSYEDISTGDTGHAEVVKVNFDSGVISLEKILKIFFLAHDPTSLNRQGSDVGTQYRSIILYTDDTQKKVIDRVVDQVRDEYEEQIVTEIKRLGNFYKAEEYHKDYYKKNPNAAYCRLVIKPKLDKVLNS